MPCLGIHFLCLFHTVFGFSSDVGVFDIRVFCFLFFFWGGGGGGLFLIGWSILVDLSCLIVASESLLLLLLLFGFCFLVSWFLLCDMCCDIYIYIFDLVLSTPSKTHIHHLIMLVLVLHLKNQPKKQHKSTSIETYLSSISKVNSQTGKK